MYLEVGDSPGAVSVLLGGVLHIDEQGVGVLAEVDAVAFRAAVDHGGELVDRVGLAVEVTYVPEHWDVPTGCLRVLCVAGNGRRPS